MERKFTEILLAEKVEQPKREFKAPEKASVPKGHFSIFLAGTIDMGNSEDWQAKLSKNLLKEINNIIIFNPRRDDWDSSWKQDIKNKQFNEQVTWELSHIEECDVLLYVFGKDSQSPITLAELGIGAGKFPDKCVVLCPEGYFRKGNVDIICHRYGIKQINDLNELKTIIKQRGLI